MTTTAPTMTWARRAELRSRQRSAIGESAIRSVRTLIAYPAGIGQPGLPPGTWSIVQRSFEVSMYAPGLLLYGETVPALQHTSRKSFGIVYWSLPQPHKPAGPSFGGKANIPCWKDCGVRFGPAIW